ncbi:MAG: MarP family serine protease, partial [Actinomycetota bacterium]
VVPRPERRRDEERADRDDRTGGSGDEGERGAGPAPARLRPPRPPPGGGRRGGAAAARAAPPTPLALVDGPAGAVVSVGALLVATWFLALNVVGGPWPQVSREIRGSAVVRALDDALPEPPSLVAEVRHFLDRYGFPDVFTGIPPAPADPVRPPTDAEVRDAFETAVAATVRVVGPACGRIQEGTGFVVAPGYVITNAHVVAGVRQPRIEHRGMEPREAIVVRFDPDLDLALLRVSGDLPEALTLAPSTVDRGAVGAAVGYPGGGPIRSVGAAVRRALDAVGRDIYDRGEVERSVYELQTALRPGNSGGPFVLTSGLVAGVVFAASSADEGIGYAISSTEVLPWLEVTLGRTVAVSTATCTD